MTFDLLEKMVEFLALGATIVISVGFVSLFGFLICDGWLRKKNADLALDAIPRQSE
jgi:hypothetical protein